MKCTNCGVEVEEGSVFCENCGSKIEAVSEDSAPMEVEESVVFCPNCGKKFTEGEGFCDECGTSLMGDLPVIPFDTDLTVKDDTKKKWGKVLIPAAAGVIVVGLAAFAAISLFGGKSSDKIPTKLVYLQDDTLQLVDLKNKKAESQEITDAFLDGLNVDNPILNREFISKDGTCLFYMEDYDGDTYDLYKTKISKPDEGEKLESKVRHHTILDDNTVVYIKKGYIYHHNGKETKKFGRGVDWYSYRVSKDQKSLYWSEYDQVGSTYYYQDLAQKKDKVKLMDEVSDFYANKELTRFYAVKDDDIYQLDQAGNKEKIAKDITYIDSIDSESGELYYVKSNSIEIPYIDLVYDDTGSISDYERGWLKENKHEFPVYELYHYGKGGEQLVSDHVYTAEGSWSAGGTYCMFYEYPVLEDLKVNWSSVGANDWYTVIEAEVRDAIITKLVSGSTIISEYDDVTFDTVRYSSKNEKLYVYSEDIEEEEGVIYEVALTGNNAGSLNEYDTDAYQARMWLATEQGLYYMKDYESYSGDLYLNGKEIASDVSQILLLNEASVCAYTSDYDSDDYSYTVNLRKDGKNTDVADDVSYSEYADDGTLVLLVDYDSTRQEGELMYFDGKGLLMIADDVAAFAPRRGSIALNY